MAMAVLNFLSRGATLPSRTAKVLLRVPVLGRPCASPWPEPRDCAGWCNTRHVGRPGPGRWSSDPGTRPGGRARGRTSVRSAPIRPCVPQKQTFFGGPHKSGMAPRKGAAPGRLHIGHTLYARNFTSRGTHNIICSSPADEAYAAGFSNTRSARMGTVSEGGKGSRRSGLNMRRSDLVQHKEKEKGATTRTSQIVFGERQHLLRVLDSLEGTELPIARMQQERRTLEELIHARTRELNQINTAWDEKIGLVLSADAKPEMLEKLVKRAPEEDFYLLRLITEHPRPNRKTLTKLAKHPYGAIRENVARHPNADANTLTYLSKDKTQPLWYLVAFNPNTPNPLQRKLRDRLKKLGEAQPTR